MARSTRRLSSANVAGSTTRRTRRSRSPRPSNGIEVLVGERIPGDGVEGEVAPAGSLGDRHGRIAGHVEAAVAASRLRLAPRQRDVDVARLVDLEALADGFHATERLEHRAKALGGEAEDFDVDVLRIAADQAVAHPAADDQGAAALGADSRRDGAGEIEIGELGAMCLAHFQLSAFAAFSFQLSAVSSQLSVDSPPTVIPRCCLS